MSKKIIIVGSGVAGPVLGMLLKYKGLNPIIYEKHSSVQNAGLVLGISPQTYKVLSILKLDKQLLSIASSLKAGITHSQLSQPPSIITQMQFPQIGEYPMVSMLKRSTYCQFLQDKAREMGVEVVHQKKVVGVREEGEGVEVEFEDGGKDEGELVVGCDGLHSGVREAIWGKEEPRYMGLVQIGGISPTPPSLQNVPATVHQHLGLSIFFNHGLANLSGTKSFWAMTIPQPTETREDWRRHTDAERQEILNGLPVVDWGHSVGELVRTSKFVTKYGLYDREVLPTWGKGRVVLVGDAAHPTSPHLGQGANQAIEDTYHLTRLIHSLPSLSTSNLASAYREYESIRIPIVTKAIAHAKKEGELRVMSSMEGCLKREEMMKSGKGMTKEKKEMLMELMKGPFEGVSEI